MEELRSRIVVGEQANAEDHLVLIPGSVTAEDLAALRRAAGNGEVLLNTEGGPRPFRIAQADLDSDTFHLVEAQ